MDAGVPTASTAPFAAFARGVQPLSPLRRRIAAAYRLPEEACLPPLLDRAAPTLAEAAQARALARRLVAAMRAKGGRGGVEGLVQEYSLSSQEGVALMCLAEALLRIPDTGTRDRLIRDKIGRGDWRAHLGHSPSPFVNAATWSLVLGGLVLGGTVAAGAEDGEGGLGQALTRLIARGGEPLVRGGVNLAMRLMGGQFVTGESIGAALANARALEARGFRYSYDMLGEAAMTAADAARYHAKYEEAVHAIGRAAAGRGVIDGPGLSIKLSALHPRYARPQRERVMAELLPRVQALALLARGYGIGLNIDAEEADRLDLSLDILERLCLDPALAGWDGVGFVVQAYQKRAPFVLDWIIDLARRAGRRVMVRLVKGAYWDSEVKRAQVDGLEGFPVFTRKPYTDVSYLACARLLLAAPDAVFPQFATHNAQTLAAVHAMAGGGFHPGQYEFQCLHGMGEPLYDEVVGPGKLDRPCRIYAPVGTHETLLAYLVRRLLENGANSSFIHRIADDGVPLDALIEDPVQHVRRLAAGVPVGLPNPAIALPRDLFRHASPGRRNAAGLDLSDESRLATLSDALLAGAGTPWRAAPAHPGGTVHEVRNLADPDDLVGHAVHATPDGIEAAVSAAAAAGWDRVPAAERAACLERAAGLLEAGMPPLLGLIVREAGRTLGNAVSEVREAVDFLRYYAAEARRLPGGTRPLGTVLCISPWNFPLAIFTGQVAAALAAGNAVLAKPAEQTPLVAAEAVRLLHQAGIPPDALHLLPGDGEVGAALVAEPRVRGVVFTGSTAVARGIQAALARRLNPGGVPVPLVAETGGQNALVVDSSALTEQVVADVLLSAFDSAGQRCSALRVLCLQEEVADRTLLMLRGALDELRVGDPALLRTDVGPVISAEARAGIEAHIGRMRAAGHACHQAALPPECGRGTFLAPAIIEIGGLHELEGEVFGPVLHVLRFARAELPALLGRINGTGYALTFGVHTRIDETAALACDGSEAGNVYVNRNLVGAVVGVQPFGGHGLSGTGPKAGGPLYLRRLLSACAAEAGVPPGAAPSAALAWEGFLRAEGLAEAADAAAGYNRRTLLGAALALPGPVGEANTYGFRPRGAVLCLCRDAAALLEAVGAALATGNRALLPLEATPAWLDRLPPALREAVGHGGADDAACVLWDGPPEALLALQSQLAARPGPIVPVFPTRPDPLSDTAAFPAEWLLRERSTSVNTAAAGGNATLMAMG